MPSNLKTRVTNGLILAALGVAGGVGGGILADNLPNSVILGNGDIVTDISLNTAPCLRANSGGYLCYQEAALTTSGTNLIASIDPSSRNGSGALIDKVKIECGGVGLATSGALIVQTSTKQSLVTGTQFRNYLVISTGSVVVVNTGSLIQTKVAQDTHINFITTATDGVAVDCKMKLWTSEKYGT